MPRTLPNLPLHLALNLFQWGTWRAASQLAKHASPPWKEWQKNLPPPLQSAHLLPEKLVEAVAQEAENRLKNLLLGVNRYLNTPYVYTRTDPPCAWQHGGARLLDYGAPHTNAPRVFFVPPLINRYYILDLLPGVSLVEYLKTRGFHCLVMDWGDPTPAEYGFNSSDYAGVICAALEHIGGPVALAGYCMGGLLALAATHAAPQHISALALLATPWDFHAPGVPQTRLGMLQVEQLERIFARQNTVPAEVIHLLFQLHDPWIFQQKFSQFSTLKENTPAAERFLALEHWVNDGVPMTADLARECFIDWAQKNNVANSILRAQKREPAMSQRSCAPMQMQEAFAGRNVPIFIAAPLQDTIVPYECAAPLADLLPNATLHKPSAGHVGMIVGQNAKRELWKPLGDWLLHRNMHNAGHTARA